MKSAGEGLIVIEAIIIIIRARALMKSAGEGPIVIDSFIIRAQAPTKSVCKDLLKTKGLFGLEHRR